MKIEKINDTQMRFILQMEDLVARNISISDIKQGTNSTRKLFGEVMQHMREEQMIDGENSFITFEAIQQEVDSIVVIATVSSDFMPPETDPRLSLMPHAAGQGKFKRLTSFMQTRESSSENSYCVFSFADMDIMAAGVARLPEDYNGPSMVYKLENRYFLMLNNESDDNKTTGELETVLHEFGQKHVSNDVSKSYLDERAEVVIDKDAVEKLRKYHAAIS